MWSTERLLSVKTSKPGSFTACGFTKPAHPVRLLAHIMPHCRNDRRTGVVLPRDVSNVPEHAIDRAMEAVVVLRS